MSSLLETSEAEPGNEASVLMEISMLGLWLVGALKHGARRLKDARSRGSRCMIAGGEGSAFVSRRVLDLG